MAVLLGSLEEDKVAFAPSTCIQFDDLVFFFSVESLSFCALFNKSSKAGLLGFYDGC